MEGEEERGKGKEVIEEEKRTEGRRNSERWKLRRGREEGRRGDNKEEGGEEGRREDDKAAEEKRSAEEGIRNRRNTNARSEERDGEQQRRGGKHTVKAQKPKTNGKSEGRDGEPRRRDAEETKKAWRQRQSMTEKTQKLKSNIRQTQKLIEKAKPHEPFLSIFLLLILLVSTTAAAAGGGGGEKGGKGDDPFDLDDDLSFALNLLYRDTKTDMDPHDMLASPAERKYARPGSFGAHGISGAGRAEEEEEEKESEAKESASSQALAACLDRLSALQDSLEGEQIASLQLQKMLAKEGILDLQAFYKRAVLHLWNTLRLDEGEEVLRDGNTALVRQVRVRVTQDDLDDLGSYLKTEKEPHRVDAFLERAFTLQDLPQDSSLSLFQTLQALVTSVLDAGKSLELWLFVLCVGFVALGLWAVMLFVRDIQTQLRWGRVLTMMCTVMFFICCLWHWRHMYKMAESKRHAQLAKRGYAGIPEECQPGATASASVYDWIKINVFGSPDVCERYFEELMIDSMEEITPGMVIAETIARFVFQPLQHLGTESAKLTTNFYKNVPVAYHLHATVLFLGLLIVVLFYGCAYGIDFPLGLGGFRPMTRPESSSSSTSAAGDKNGLGQEALEQLKLDRERFLEESRRMLRDISCVALGWQGQQQPLVVASSNIIEVQLEQLISRHLSRAMEQQQQQHPQAVRTITSTPLRTEGHPALQEAQEEPQRHSLLGDLSSSSEGSEDTSSSSGLLVSTDAVHRRMADTPPVKVLPPRTSHSNSRSSSTASTPAPSEMNSPTSVKRKSRKFWRKCHSEEEDPSRPHPIPSGSTQSLRQAGLDEPDLGVPPDSDSFLAEVRNILDFSANSGPPSPPESSGRHSKTKM